MQDTRSIDIHRGTIFTLTSDPSHSHEISTYRDCFNFFEDGALIVDRDSGVVVAVGNWSDLFAKEKNGWNLEECTQTGGHYFDHRPHWILPGLVDGHTHLPQLPVAGRSGLYLNEWLKHTIYPAEARFSDTAYARQVAQSFFAEMAATGTTTAVVMTTTHAEATAACFEEAIQSRLRIFMGKMLMDINAPDSLLEDVETGISQSNDLCQRFHGGSEGRIQYVFSPRFAISCSRRLLEATAKAAQENRVGIHTHINEAKPEVAHALETHDWAQNYTDIYLKTGLINETALAVLAHQVHPRSEEIEAIKGFPVCTVHCPTSNAALRSGDFDFLHVFSHGLERIALGSDVGAGPELSLFDVMRGAGEIEKNNLSVFHLFYLATLGGAKALGLSTGALVPGYEADFIVVDPQKANPHPLEPLKDLNETLSVLINRGCGKGGLVVQTHLRGEKIFPRQELFSSTTS